MKLIPAYDLDILMYIDLESCLPSIPQWTGSDTGPEVSKDERPPPQEPVASAAKSYKRYAPACFEVGGERKWQKLGVVKLRTMGFYMWKCWAQF